MPQRSVTTLLCKDGDNLVECAVGRMLSRALRLKFYLGNLCPNGHSVEVDGLGIMNKSIRYTSGGQCKSCESNRKNNG